MSNPGSKSRPITPSNLGYTVDELKDYDYSDLLQVAAHYGIKINKNASSKNIIRKILDFQRSLKKYGKINYLPTDVLTILGEYLSICDIIRFCRINKKMNGSLCQNRLFLRNIGHMYLTERNERLPSITEILETIYYFDNISENSKQYGKKLYHAARQGYEKVLEKLVNKYGSRSLINKQSTRSQALIDYIYNLAIMNGYLDIIDYAISMNGILDMDLISSAVANGNIDVINHLIDKYPGDYELLRRVLNSAAWAGDKKLFDYILSLIPEDILLDLIDNSRTVTNAAQSGNLGMLEELVDLGANINANSDTLENAIRSKNLDVIEYLIASGVNTHGITVTDAVASGNLAIVKYLESLGIYDADYTNQLDNAIFHGHLDLIEYLLENGADVHAENDDTLLTAIGLGKLDIVKYLVEHGANIYVDGDSALKKAAQKAIHGKPEILRYLLSVGNYPKDVRRKYEKYLTRKTK